MPKKEIVCPFSGFEGQLFYQGKPAAGARITRSYELFKEKGEETIFADEEGRFRFESIFIPFKTPFLAPVEFLSYQNIYVSYEKHEFHVWTSSKGSKLEYAEFGGAFKTVTCEITDEPIGVDVEDGLLVTSCIWK